MQRNCCVYGACLYSLYLSLFKSIPEVTFNGQWLAEKISDNIVNLIEMGPCAPGKNFFKLCISQVQKIERN